MLKFKVEDMTCGHCVATITKAIQQIDSQATLAADVPNHVVQVISTADGKAIESAIRDAGYTPQALG